MAESKQSMKPEELITSLPHLNQFIGNINQSLLAVTRELKPIFIWSPFDCCGLEQLAAFLSRCLETIVYGENLWISETIPMQLAFLRISEKRGNDIALSSTRVPVQELHSCLAEEICRIFIAYQKDCLKNQGKHVVLTGVMRELSAIPIYRQLMPGAKFIFLLRHPREVMLAYRDKGKFKERSQLSSLL